MVKSSKRRARCKGGEAFGLDADEIIQADALVDSSCGANAKISSENRVGQKLAGNSFREEELSSKAASKDTRHPE